MNRTILTKSSNPSDIERYFRGILELDKQNKEFSVNLDDVWQLAYTRKDAADQEGLDYRHIQRALLNKKKYGGVYWEYYSLPNIDEFVKRL